MVTRIAPLATGKALPAYSNSSSSYKNSIIGYRNSSNIYKKA
jgi:hypothetical protein